VTQYVSVSEAPEAGAIHGPKQNDNQPASAWRSNDTNMGIKRVFRSFLQDESGQDLVEYALVAALIALVAIAGLNGLATSINSEFTSIGAVL